MRSLLRTTLCLFAVGGVTGGCDVLGEQHCQPDARIDLLEREVAELRDALSAALAAQAKAPGAAANDKGRTPDNGAVQIEQVNLISEHRRGDALYDDFSVEVTVANTGAVPVRLPKVVAQVVYAEHTYPKGMPRQTMRMQAIETLSPNARQTVRLEGFAVGHPEESHLLVAQVICPPSAKHPCGAIKQQRLRVVFGPGTAD